MDFTIKKQLEALSPKEVAVANNIELVELWKMIWNEYKITNIHERHKLPKHIRLNTFSNKDKIERRDEIIKLRKKHWTYQEIADKYEISRQRVEQIINGK